MIRLLGLVLAVLVIFVGRAEAQIGCSVLPQSTLLSLFSDNAPAASILPVDVRDVICSVLMPPNISGISTFTQNVAGGTNSVASNTPLDGIYSTGGGALVEMCPGYNFGCPPIGHIRAQFATIATSAGNAGVQESGLYSYMVDNTGYASVWANNQAYTSGSQVSANSNDYIETNPSCTSAATGSGPSGNGSSIVDGSCAWNAIGVAALSGKIALASTILANPGGASAWSGDFDTFIEPGWLAGFATGMEVDITDDSSNASATKYDLYLGGSVGNEPITAYLAVSPFATNGSNYMATRGLWFAGAHTIQDYDIEDTTESLETIFDAGTHGTASYYDGSTSPTGIYLQGTYSTGIALNANAKIQATGFQVNNTAGVSCSAGTVSLATLTVINGIVTHC